MIGVVSYGAYLPHRRLRRDAIGDVLGGPRRAGTRTVAGYDEDTTSMAVEAARIALRDPGLRTAVRSVFFATSAPAYLDKTNATAIHAALRLDPGALAVDLGTAVHSAVGALAAAVNAAGGGTPSVAVLSDIRTGRPGSADEIDGGDAAAALVLARDSASAPVIAELVGSGHSTVEVLERWRIEGMPSSRVWEERFGEQVYLPAATDAVTDALKVAGVDVGAIDHLVVSGLHARTVSRLPAALGTRVDATADHRGSAAGVGEIGNPGVAQPGVLMADVLDRADVGSLIALLVVGDGASAFLFRATDALPARRSHRPVAAQVAAGDDTLPYASFLSWRGFLDREPPRRPDPEPAYAPPSWRRAVWKFGFVASRCTACGTRHLPPSAVCTTCFAHGEMAPEPMADVPATVATSTVDRLAATPSPPLVLAVLDFAGGGRFRCELTDAGPGDAEIGSPVEMTFRRTATAAGIHNYFWKARPARLGRWDRGAS